MRNFLLFGSLIVLFWACSSTSAETNENVTKFSDEHGWLLDYPTALNAAKEQNKHVLLLFTGSDWCRPCKWLESDVFNSDQFKSYAKDNLVLVKADFPRRRGNELSPEQTRKNRELSNQFGIRSFPTVYLLDSSGKKIKVFKGYGRSGVDSYLGKIKAAIGG